MHASPCRLLYFLAFAFVAVADSPSPATCDALLSALPGVVSFPESAVYNTSILSYPFLQLRLSPTCVVRPNTTQDVAAIITILSKDNQTRFAIRGGGHNINTGFNNIDDGVTIDMRGLNAVELAWGNEVVGVGAGAIGQDVYDTLHQYNITVLGPRIGAVGITGFTTGGGINFLSPYRGWASDSVVNFEVVLFSGEIVNANATYNSDLYTALKGGQSNFGVVTRLDLRTYPQGPIWGGRVVYAENGSTALLSAYTTFKDEENYDPYAAGWVTIAYNHTTAKFTPISILFYTNPQSKPGALGGILNSGPQVTNGMIEAPIAEHTRNASRAGAAVARRVIWATTTFQVSPTILNRIHAFWSTLVPSICSIYPTASISAELTFQSLPPPPEDTLHSSSFGLTDTNNTNYEKTHVFAQVIFLYTDPTATPGLEKALKDLIERIDEFAEDEAVAHKFRYLNFSAWWQDPMRSYGVETKKKKLRSVARKYDPEGVFQRLLAGGFKLY